MAEVLGELRGPFSTPMLGVLHAPDRALTEGFAARLQKTCRHPVKLAENGEAVYDGVVYLAPGGSHISLTCDRPAEGGDDPGRRRFRLWDKDPMWLTPSIDRAMRSAALAYGKGVQGVLLSGLGEDGVEGLRAIRSAGGRTIAQDQSAAVWGMPKAAIDAGLVDEVLSPVQIGRILQEVERPCPRRI